MWKSTQKFRLHCRYCWVYGKSTRSGNIKLFLVRKFSLWNWRSWKISLQTVLKLLFGILDFLSISWSRNRNHLHRHDIIIFKVLVQNWMRFKVTIKSFSIEIYIKIIIKLVQRSYVWCTWKREYLKKSRKT